MPYAKQQPDTQWMDLIARGVGYKYRSERDPEVVERLRERGKANAERLKARRD
jgi:hypothetical protein